MLHSLPASFDSDGHCYDDGQTMPVPRKAVAGSPPVHSDSTANSEPVCSVQTMRSDSTSNFVPVGSFQTMRSDSTAYSAQVGPFLTMRLDAVVGSVRSDSTTSSTAAGSLQPMAFVAAGSIQAMTFVDAGSDSTAVATTVVGSVQNTDPKKRDSKAIGSH